jgi:hypothetical protein
MHATVTYIWPPLLLHRCRPHLDGVEGGLEGRQNSKGGGEPLPDLLAGGGEGGCLAFDRPNIPPKELDCFGGDGADGGTQAAADWGAGGCAMGVFGGILAGCAVPVVFQSFCCCCAAAAAVNEVPLCRGSWSLAFCARRLGLCGGGVG